MFEEVDSVKEYNSEVMINKKISQIFQGRERKGVVWSGVERFSAQGVQFIITLVLARLLTPEDYGLIAIVNIFLVVFQTINETGFGAALMQKIDRDELDYSSVFVFNVVLGVLLYSVLFFGAPFISYFFKNEQLTLLTRVVGVNIIITSFVVVQRAKLIIKVDFKTQAKASILSALGSGIIGIVLAYLGYGVMALVAQSVLHSVINTVLIWIFSKWHPRISFSWDRFKRLFAFAYKLTLARLINVIYNEIAPVFIGRVISPADLGFYNRAYSFQTLPANNIVGIVQRVSTPLLCEQQKDLNKMKETLSKFIVKTASWVFPIMMGLGLLAEPMILFLLTDKWAPSIGMLQLICPIGAIYVLNSFNLNIFNALNRTDLALKLEITKKIISISLVVASIRFGVKALLVSQIVVSLIELFFNTYYTKKLIHFGLVDQLKALKKIIFAVLIMGVVVFLSTFFISNNLLKLLLGTVSGAITYIFILKKMHYSML